MRAPIRSSDSAASALSTASGQPTDAHEDDADDGRVHAVTWLATSSARGPYAIACLRSPRVFSCSVSSSPKVASIVSRVRSRSVCSATQARRSASQVSLRRIPGAGRERSRPDRLRRTRAVEGARAAGRGVPKLGDHCGAESLLLRRLLLQLVQLPSKDARRQHGRAGERRRRRHTSRRWTS